MTSAHRNAAPVFGEWFTGIHASDENPQKHGMYVRTIRRTGRTNPGTYYELTDGGGRFWEYPIESVVRRDQGGRLFREVDVRPLADAARQQVRDYAADCIPALIKASRAFPAPDDWKD